ncbi:hypothetical protein Rs2_29147 [Raphanus sativus]|nr:hypothetical protein Rs2_29147 [Raphanus sativus]
MQSIGKWAVLTERPIARRPGSKSGPPARRNGTSVCTPGAHDVSLGARRLGRESGHPACRNGTSVWTPGAQNVSLGTSWAPGEQKRDVRLDAQRPERKSGRPGRESERPTSKNETSGWMPGAQDASRAPGKQKRDVCLDARRPGRESGRPACRNRTTFWTPGAQDANLGARHAKMGRPSARPAPRT